MIICGKFWKIKFTKSWWSYPVHMAWYAIFQMVVWLTHDPVAFSILMPNVMTCKIPSAFIAQLWQIGNWYPQSCGHQNVHYSYDFVTKWWSHDQGYIQEGETSIHVTPFLINFVVSINQVFSYDFAIQVALPDCLLFTWKVSNYSLSVIGSYWQFTDRIHSIHTVF